MTGLTDEAELSFILSVPCFSSSPYRMKKGDNFRYLPYRVRMTGLEPAHP